jgi:hypothetical protein
MAFVTLARQDTQIRTSDVYDDSIAPTEAAFETNPLSVEDDLNNVRSMLHELRDARNSNWWAALIAPTTIETGTIRGVQDVNDALHLVEKKRVLADVHNLTDIAVGGADNWVILDGGAAELPGNTTAAVGAVATLGTVVAAHGGTFGTHSLAEVAGANALNPKNLCAIFDGTTRDPILSGGRVVWGLLQGESGVTDGVTITTATTTRVQLSFVRVNATGDDLEACPAVDIQGSTINYCNRERFRLEDLTEEQFLKGAIIDAPGGTTVDRQTAYNNQGTTPVDLTTNATLDLEAASIQWLIRDNAEADLFGIVEGSAGGTSQFNIYAGIDEFDIDAVVTNFANGVTIDSGSASPVTVGVTDGHVETSSGDLHLQAAAEMYLDDVNQVGSTWAQTDGVKLSETTAEWDAYEVAFGGEVSLLNAIVQAAAASTTRQVARATVQNATGSHAAGLNITGNGATPELDAQLTDYSTMTFVDDVDIYLNGDLLWPAAGATKDVYPGDTPANGDLKFTDRLFNGDVIQMITWG